MRFRRSATTVTPGAASVRLFTSRLTIVDGRTAWMAANLSAARCSAPHVGRRVAGYLAGGMTSWREEKRPVERTARLTVDGLHERWESDRQSIQVFDVREHAEWEDGHIPGSVHEPYHDIRHLPEGIDPDQPVAVVCGSGQRAAVGASLLQRYGARDVIHVVEGGVPLWQRQGWPVDAPGTTGT